MDLIFDFLFTIVKFLVDKLGHFGVFIAMTIESACIPLPSEIILPFSGYLVWKGEFNLWLATLAGTFGNTAGSLIAYIVGFYGGKPFVLKYGKYFFVSHNDYYRAEKRFNQYGDSIAFFSRLLPIIRTFVSLPCGVAGMNLPKFLVYTTLGSFIWSLLFIYLGFKLGENWEALSPIFHKLDTVSLVVIGILVSAYVYKKVKNKAQVKKTRP